MKRGRRSVSSRASFSAAAFSFLSSQSFHRVAATVQPADQQPRQLLRPKPAYRSLLYKGHIRSVAIQIQPVKTATLKLGQRAAR